MEGTRREGDDTRPKRSLFTCGPFHLHPLLVSVRHSSSPIVVSSLRPNREAAPPAGKEWRDRVRKEGCKERDIRTCDLVPWPLNSCLKERSGDCKV